MSLHKSSDLRITVVDPVEDTLDWPVLQTSSLLTPSLFPHDVTDGEDVLRLTPNSGYDRSGWPNSRTPTRTPSSNHTFGFPLSPRSSLIKSPRTANTPLEKQKRRLKRYDRAESSLARLSASSTTLAPSQLHRAAIQFAARAVTVHIGEARLSLEEIVRSGRRDNVRWMAERRLAALKALQTELKSEVSSVGAVSDHRCDENLVRFLGTGSGEGRVPIFTRKRARQPVSPIAAAEMEQRRMMAGSPMKLQAEVPAPLTSRSEWSWDTRIRAVLLYPTPKPKPKPKRTAPLPTPQSPLRVLTDTHTSYTSTGTRTSYITMSTPTSDSFSPVTPLTEAEEEEEENDDDYEEYPTFLMDSAESYTPWRPPEAPQKGPRPISTNLRPDVTYGWLADPSTWSSPSAWHGDGWEVTSPSTPSVASPMLPSSSLPIAGQRPNRRSKTLPQPPVPAPAPAPVTAPPAPLPATRFWSRARPTRPSSLRPIEEQQQQVKNRDSVDSQARRPLPPRPLPAPPTPVTPLSAPALGAGAGMSPPPLKERGMQFLSGLVRVRRATHHPDSLAAGDFDDAGSPLGPRDSNKLRKRGSARSLRSMLGERSAVRV